MEIFLNKISLTGIKSRFARKWYTIVRSPTPIFTKFGPEVGFGPKPTPDDFFSDFDPKNGVILGSEGSKNLGFSKHIFECRITQEWSREHLKVPLASKWAHERPRKISRGYVKRGARYGQLREKRVVLIKLFYL